jgi:hypothetical protein
MLLDLWGQTPGGVERKRRGGETQRREEVAFELCVFATWRLCANVSDRLRRVRETG